MSAVATPPRPGGGTLLIEPDVQPKIVGENDHDRVTSLLMAFVVGAFLTVCWLGLVWFTTSGFNARRTAPINLVEVFNGGGGSPEGEIDSIQEIDVPGAEAADLASNATDASEFEPPTLEQTPETVLDALTDSVQQVADVAPTMPTGTPESGGTPSSRVGTGGPAFGDGPGDGGVPAHDRWSIVYSAGQTLEEYARQLDFMRVELGFIKSGMMEYASNLAAPQPRRRSGSGPAEQRLFFLSQGTGRRDSDAALLRKSGVDPGNSEIFQFYSEEIANTLREIEFRHKGLKPTEIKFTRFRVVPNGNAYRIDVIAQEPLQYRR